MKLKREPVFYCQLDYEHVPFPSPERGFGDLANNGCGPLAVSMLIENMLGEPFPPEESAKFFLACGRASNSAPTSTSPRKPSPKSSDCS